MRSGPRAAGSPPADNPLRAGMRQERLPDPCALVIFGASGDFTGIGHRPHDTRICRRTRPDRAFHSSAFFGGVNGK